MSMEITDELLERVDSKVSSNQDADTVTCPCCGSKTLRHPVSPSAELLDQFMACAVTGEPYKQTYDLYGGRAHMDVSCVTAQLADKTTRAVSMLEPLKNKFPQLSGNIATLQDNLRIYACIDRLVIDSGAGAVFLPSAVALSVIDDITDVGSRHTAGELSDAEAEALCGGWCAKMSDPHNVSGMPRQVMNSVVLLHMHMYNILLETGFDENFWTRIKLA